MIEILAIIAKLGSMPECSAPLPVQSVDGIHWHKVTQDIGIGFISDDSGTAWPAVHALPIRNPMAEIVIILDSENGCVHRASVSRKRRDA